MSTPSDPDVYERMLLADPEEEFRQVCMCIRLGDVAKARELYHGVNLNRPLSIWDRRPPLHLAISKSDAYMIRFLLQEGNVDPNMTDDKGRTSLHVAVLEGNNEIIQLLIDHGGINFKAVDKWGQTALHLASLCANTSAAQLLLEHCRECLHYRQQDGITPLQIATMADNKHIAALFSASNEHDTLRSNTGLSDAAEIKENVNHDLPTPPSIHSIDEEESQDIKIERWSCVQEISDLPTPPSTHYAVNYILNPAPERQDTPERSNAVDPSDLSNQSMQQTPQTEMNLQSDSIQDHVVPAEIYSPSPVQIKGHLMQIPGDSWKHSASENSSLSRSLLESNIVYRDSSLFFDFESRRTLSESLLHHSEHLAQVSESHSILLNAYSSELQSKQEEISTLKALLVRFLQTHSQLASHAPSVEELFAALISERVAANHSQNLWKQLDAMAHQVKCKDNELEEMRHEISTLKSQLANLKSKKWNRQNSSSVENVSESRDHASEGKQPKVSDYVHQLASTSSEYVGFGRHSRLEDKKISGPASDLPSVLALESASDSNDIWILDWNMAGFVVSSVVEKPTRRIQVTFTNTDSRPVSDIRDSKGFNKASLGPFSVVFSCPRRQGQPATLYYKCFDSASANSDWSAVLPEEDVLALCLIGRHAAICSDRGILRIMSQSGIHLSILCLDYPAVSLAASSSDDFAVIMLDPSGCYHYMLFHIDMHADVRKLASGVCPVSSNSTTIWSGFSEQGLFVFLDSAFCLRGLVSMQGSHQWIALLNAAACFTKKHTHIVPIGVSLSDLNVAIVKKDLVEFLTESPLPAPRKLTFKLPTITVNGQDPIIEQRFLLNNVLINHFKSQEAAGKRRSEDEVACARLLGEQDASIIELFQVAVKDNNINRALDLSACLRNNLNCGRSSHFHPNSSLHS